MQKRIDMYEQSTKEVLGFYRNKNLLYKVDASHQPEEVFDEIKVILSSESVY